VNTRGRCSVLSVCCTALLSECPRSLPRSSRVYSLLCLQQIVPIIEMERLAPCPLLCLGSKASRGKDRAAVSVLVQQRAVELAHDPLAHRTTPILALDDPFLAVLALDHDVHTVITGGTNPLGLMPKATIELGHYLFEIASGQLQQAIDVGYGSDSPPQTRRCPNCC